MDERYALTTGFASTQFGAVSTKQLEQINVDANVRRRWIAMGLLERLGPKSFAIVGSPLSWQRSVHAAVADIDGAGYPAGRSAARLNALDGFGDDDEVELLVTRQHRNLRTPHRLRSTSFELGVQDTVTIDGIRCLSAERLILDAPLFAFDRSEIENAIDSAIRLKVVNEQRLRSRVISRHRRSINNGRALLDALVDTGGESRLERWFLGIVRRGGLPRPLLQKTWRVESRTVARVDAFFDGGLVVEIAGHGTHSSRRDRQRDEQRRTELVLRGLRVITFTYDDIRDRPDWVLARLREALALVAA
jgi:hypothetical protein